MARISTKYDSDLKEQVLVLRGDEGYARSTKTLLELGNPSIQTDYFNLPVTVNVLRDRDKGTILLYDNDVLLYTIDNWTAQDNARTVTLTGLTFDIQHNIVARYMGNNKCSPSRSTIQTISVEDTRRTEAILTLETGTTQFDTNGSYTDTIILSNTVDEEYNQNQPIEIRYDGNLITTVTTNSEGKASFTIPDVGANGLHNISFHLEATRNLTTCDLSIDLSVGYEVTITSYSKVMVKGGRYSVTANIKDYFGNLQDVENISNVKLQAISRVQTYFWNMGRISKGVYFVGIPITSSHLNINKISVGLWNGDVKRYSSAYIPVTVISLSSLTITSSTPQLYKNEGNVLSIQSSSVVEGIPIELTGAVEETVYTDSDGLAVTTLTGTGRGSKTVTASAGDATASSTLEDFIQYWIPGDIHNRECQVRQCSLYDLNNYFRINVNSQGYLGVPIDETKDYAMYMERVSSNLGFDISFLRGNYNEGWSAYGSSQINVPKLSTATILLVKRGNTFKLTVGNGTDSYHRESTVPSSQNAMGIVMGYPNLQLTFEKLTLQELE